MSRCDCRRDSRPARRTKSAASRPYSHPASVSAECWLDAKRRPISRRTSELARIGSVVQRVGPALGRRSLECRPRRRDALALMTGQKGPAGRRLDALRSRLGAADDAQDLDDDSCAKDLGRKIPRRPAWPLVLPSAVDSEAKSFKLCRLFLFCDRVDCLAATPRSIATV